jgi:DNA-binding IclR family transcriptional regulator
MSLGAIRNAVEMTTHPKLSQLLAVLVEHSGLTVSEAAPLLDLPSFVVLRFADRLVRLGYAARSQSGDKRYFATIAGRNMDAVMRRPRP